MTDQKAVRTGVMSARLHARAINLDGSHKTDDQADKAIQRICRKAGLPVRHWHTLRHAFGTHAALFGVNPWRLQAWQNLTRVI